MYKKTSAAVAAVLLGLMTAPGALAADYIPANSICIPIQPAKLLQVEDNIELKKAVVDIMNEAVATSEDATVIGSRRPAFVWASEAKIACGKAYGYLQSDYRDEQYLNKCECFFRRMQHYLY